MTTTTQPTRYWVAMVDEFMSGWGPAKGKINLLVIECANGRDQDIVYQNAKDCGDMRDIKRLTSPGGYPAYYPSDKYYVSYKELDQYRSWHKPNYFKE